MVCDFSFAPGTSSLRKGYTYLQQIPYIGYIQLPTAGRRGDENGGYDCPRCGRTTAKGCGWTFVKKGIKHVTWEMTPKDVSTLQQSTHRPLAILTPFC